MNRVAAALALGLGFLTISTDAFADWTVVRSTGLVWLVAPDSTSRPPLAGEVVPNSWMLATGPDGRVLLMRGDETITVSPSTQLVLTEHGQATQAVQPIGTVAYDVEVRMFRHFVVETPILAAVVKGTRFTVTTDGITGAVQVERGAVEVKSMGTGRTTLVATGQEVLVAGLYAALDLHGQGAIGGGQPAGFTPGNPLPDAGHPALTVVVGETVTNVAGGVGTIVNTVIETTTPIVETVAEVVEETTEVVEEIVEETTETVIDVVDDLLDGLGGLFGN